MMKQFTVSGTAYSLVLAIMLMMNVFGCASRGPYEIDLMPAPEVYSEESIDPFISDNPLEKIPYSGILYVTDRQPAQEQDEEQYYRNARGHLLRLGVARIELGKSPMTWEEARRISLLKNRTDAYPLKVTAVREIGVLDRSISPFTDFSSIPDDPRKPAEEFSSMIKEKLALSRKKDIYIYLHGFKVIFENPLLVATELWHFLGYDGVFIAFAWPSTPSNLAYVSDLETAAYSSRSLRVFLDYLAEETSAERIHIIAYSAGTRVAIGALEQITLITTGQDSSAVHRKYRIGNVILVGSDFDRDIFGGYLVDGMLNVPERLTVYLSKGDKALGVSRWIFDRQRLGQMFKDRSMPATTVEYLRTAQNLVGIDVSEAEDATAGNGHAYFRNSPWVSSDILMTLMYDLEPENRGLEYMDDQALWTFPADYVKRLRERIDAMHKASVH